MYTVSIFLAIAKICFMALLPPLQPQIFTILYNFSGVINVFISSIVPIRLISIRATPLKKLEENNFYHIISIIAVMSAILAICFISVYYLGYSILPDILLFWRILFIGSATIEMICLSYVTYLYWNSTRKDRFLAICVATLFMRFGIVLIIILKLLNIYPPMYMSMSHMSAVIIGLLSFSFKKVVEKGVRHLSSGVIPSTQVSTRANSTNIESTRSTHQDNAKSTHQESVRDI